MNAATTAPPRPVALERLGRLSYGRAEAWQRATAEDVRGGGPERLALLEHHPVYTLGARADRTHLLIPEAELAHRGASLVAADRGGDITFHGPGQLVAYPILDLRARGLRAADYVRALEDVAIACVAAFGVEAGRRSGARGAWVGADKLAAVGVRIDRGISRHGLALNVSTDLAWFDSIVPCGIEDAGVTSLALELGEAPPMDAVIEAFAGAFEGVFGA
jgi:lipoyl(octanoyl) transferase